MALIAVMDELATWRDVERALEAKGRGAKNRLAKHLKMDPSYLGRLLDRGDDLKINQARQIKSFFDDAADAGGRVPEPEPRRRAPMYGYAAGSSGDRIAFNPGEIIEWIELPPGMDPRGDVFTVRAIGSSMEPRIFDGETLVVQRGMPPARGRDAVIEFNDGSAVVKTYKGQKDGHVFAWQYNPDTEVRFEMSTVKAVHAVYCRL